MYDKDFLLTPDTIQMLVSSVTHQGHNQLTAIEAERLLNAIARAQSGVPTGPATTSRQSPDHN